MTDQATQQDRSHQPLPKIPKRPPRSSLLLKDRRPEGSIWMRKRVWNANYAGRLKADGIPTRREVAEAVLQAVIEEIEHPRLLKREVGTSLLAEVIGILHSVHRANGKPAFTRPGITKRIKQIALPFASSADRKDPKPS